MNSRTSDRQRAILGAFCTLPIWLLELTNARPRPFLAEVLNGESAKIRLGGPIYHDGQHVIAVHENTVLTYSSEAPNPGFLQAWTRTVEQVIEQLQAGLLAVTIIECGVRAPDDGSRLQIRNTLMRHAAELQAFAYVVEGEGFGAAAVRGAISLISLAARYPFPLKVFGRAEEAVPWMLNRPHRGDRRASVPKLLSVANSLRDELRSGTKTA